MARVIRKDNKKVKEKHQNNKRNGIQFIIFIISTIILFIIIGALIYQFFIDKETTVEDEVSGIITYLIDYQEITEDDDERIFEVKKDALFITDDDLPDRYYVYLYDSNYGTTNDDEEDTESEAIEEYVIQLFESILTLEDVNIYIIDINEEQDKSDIVTDYEFNDEDEQTISFIAPTILEVDSARAELEDEEIVRDINDNLGVTIVNKIFAERQAILSE